MKILNHELSIYFGAYLASASPATTKSVKHAIYESIQQTLNTQAIIVDIVPRMQTSVAASVTPLVDSLAVMPPSILSLEKIPAFKQKVADPGSAKGRAPLGRAEPGARDGALGQDAARV
ncbi:hypothetical protein FRB96_002096 [Tulasnella sp. 330]|nr:hypothetical protein FRB96_002096 [Tulasnella sp. 330]KAG8869437.1 hypothetical protein FRB97_001231 [Tulasnella sp. 331]KAG8873031.1 hypothetical protein FRB98_009239 [Tulasnella sp. 332]